MSHTSPTFSIVTLGCRVNQYESDAIADLLEKNGFIPVPFSDPADITIVNTCTVTAESDRKSRQLIRRAAACNIGKPVIVTGCFSQVSPEEVPGADGLTVVMGNGEKDRIPAIAKDLIETGRTASAAVGDIFAAAYDSFTLTVPHRTRSYIKIEDGCENRCSYCIIPMARGKVRSKAEDVILREAEQLIQVGSGEIIFTGIETASYGRDLFPHERYGAGLSALLEKADKLPGIQRIGLGSLEPTVMNEEFVASAAGLRHLLPHFHLSIQSGSTTVLNRMRRRYTAERALQSIERMKGAIPEATYSADVIVGFPGETDAEFEETVVFCRNVGFLHLHIFPYSIRKGTDAAVMPNQVPQPIKRERLKRLEGMQAEVKKELLDRYCADHDGERPVYLLVEKTENGKVSGHSEHFVEVFVPHPDHFVDIGAILPIRLTHNNGDVCFGVVAE